MTLFLLGIAISIPISILAPFVTTWIQQRLSRRYVGQAEARIALLNDELGRVRRMKDEPIEFVALVATRVLGLTLALVVTWLLTNIASIFGATSSVVSIANGQILTVVDNVSSWVYVVDGLVEVVLLTTAFRYGMRAFRISQKVARFDDYEREVEAELNSLTARLASSS